MLAGLSGLEPMTGPARVEEGGDYCVNLSGKKLQARKKHAEKSRCVQEKARWTVGRGRGEVDQGGDRVQMELQGTNIGTYVTIATSIRLYLPIANQAR